MNCTVHSTENRTYLASGQESHCQLYSVDMSISESKKNKKENKENSSVKNRKKNDDGKTLNESSHDINSISKVLTFKLKSLDSIQTDFR